MEINATLIHHLDQGDGIYAWTPMILDGTTMEAWRDENVDDHWDMEELLARLNEYGGWLELRVDDSEGKWAWNLQSGRPDPTSADSWLIPAALVIDERTIEDYDNIYGEQKYVVITELDA